MLFSAGEKVLCFHVGLLYEAKVGGAEGGPGESETDSLLTRRDHDTSSLSQVLKAEKWTGDDNLNKDVGPHYLVHYQGWRARCECRARRS